MIFFIFYVKKNNVFFIIRDLIIKIEYDKIYIRMWYFIG